MPEFQVYVEMIDSQNRKTSKEFTTVDTMADAAAATTAAAGLLTDLGNLTGLRILAYTVKQRIVYTDIVDAGSNIDEGITLSMEKEDNQLGIIKVPGPINTIYDGDGNVDVLDAAVAAFVSNFLTGGDFTFSDGEQANEIVRGKLDT